MPYAILFAPIGSEDFQPIAGDTYEQGADAATRMKELQALNADTIRYKVRRVADEDVDPNAWRDRERDQFSTNRYIPCPWHGEYWNDYVRWEHYAHLSLKEPGKIAYTASPEHGRADRQTIIAPGRYLKRYFSDRLSPQEIEHYAAQVSVCSGDCELSFTSDPDEIEEVYCNGPNSCMSHSESDYRGHCHPVRAYGNSPDLQLAYIGDKDDASGRVIVWPERKIYTTPYGDCSRLRILLDNAGYSYGALTGARLKPISDDNGNGYIMPYIDGIGYAEARDGFLVLGRGDIECQSTEGTSEEAERYQCSCCGDSHNDEDDLSYVEDVSENWCGSCIEQYATRCDHEGAYYTDRRNSFHEVYSLSRYNRELTSITVVEGNLEDAGATYHDASGEYVDGELFQLVTALEELAVSTVELANLPDPNQLDLALETIALEALAVAA